MVLSFFSLNSNIQVCRFDMFIVSFTVQFAGVCDNDVCMSNSGAVFAGFKERNRCIELCECVAGLCLSFEGLGILRSLLCC